MREHKPTSFVWPKMPLTSDQKSLLTHSTPKPFRCPQLSSGWEHTIAAVEKNKPILSLKGTFVFNCFVEKTATDGEMFVEYV